MGDYINPKNMTKEEWLEKNAMQIKMSDFITAEFSGGERLMVLVDNGAFTACAVCYSPEELECFKELIRSGRNDRPMTFWIGNSVVVGEAVTGYEIT